MKETINNIHIVSKGIVLSIILHMIVIGFLVVTGFNASLPLFTLILLVVMAVSGFYVGTISDRYAEINGLIIAIFTSTIVLFYIAQYTEMDWAVNRIVIASYLVIGFLSSLVSRLTNKKQRIKNKLELKDKLRESGNVRENYPQKVKSPKNYFSVLKSELKDSSSKRLSKFSEKRVKNFNTKE
ncbi:hypothetical protein [Priestia megaterium]|uniref:Uncharacterized protein n=1 Tax=Priestia megaterium TaxID=1404 RepID=A0A6M6EAX6_PRIMG|nr:hypothetical protein [Priestia megaterium]QJX80705.1 hypothetical protein FDZ14_31950 [Priestia megaterium]